MPGSGYGRKLCDMADQGWMRMEMQRARQGERAGNETNWEKEESQRGEQLLPCFEKHSRSVQTRVKGEIGTNRMVENLASAPLADAQRSVRKCESDCRHAMEYSVLRVVLQALDGALTQKSQSRSHGRKRQCRASLSRGVLR